MTHSSSIYATGGAITNPTVGSSGGFGVKTWPSYLLDIVPLTKNATAFAASQTLAGAGNIALTAGTGVTASVVNNVTRYTADVERCVTITSAGNDSGITFLVSGYDLYGAPMTSQVTGANAGVATTLKAFMSIVSIAASAATASTVTAGTADIFGMPTQVIDKGYISTLNWAEVIGEDGGTFVIADLTSPATKSTGDVRGTYLPSSASNGTKRLVVQILLNATQINSSPAVANTTAILGVTQV